jgi:hypothetical protein
MKNGIELFAGLLALIIVLAPVQAYSSDVNKMLADARQATVQYHDIDTALADGYTSTVMCVSNPAGAGAMGVHYVNNALLFDGIINETKPDVLIYEPKKNGFKLVAAEYIMPVVGPLVIAPQAFGQNMSYEPAGDLPFNHYELHVWLWQGNPSGIFQDWNPNVKCSA